MGVHGLWKLIDKAGRPIPIESLENKVLAIDVSIWLYQLVRGFDSSARPGSNMFLLGLFHRICKLLFYRIKPIFVFDGGVPSLKKKTIAARQKGRRKAQESIEKVRQQLLENLIKQQALGDVLGENVKIPKQFASKQDELFWLPPRTEDEAAITQEEESDSSEDERLTRKYVGDLNSVDVNSEDFLKLPADVRHDILSDLKETRKLNSWARIHLMPEEADDFSSFQMGRLLKRRAVQVGLDKAAEELGVRGFTVNDLENILTEQGIDLSQRIAGDSSTRFIYSSNPGAKKNIQSERSEDEDDVSELYHPSRELSKSKSSDSEDEILPVVQNMASRENGDLSQSEILELIKQQQGKSENFDADWNRAGTSKSGISLLGKEESESANAMGAQDRVNDPTVTRGKDSDGNNEKSKLGPGNLPGASPLSKITTSQKDTLLWSNQAGGVSPSKNVPGSGNEALEERKSLGSNEEVESADGRAGLVKDDSTMDASPDCSNQSSENVAKGLEIVIKPEDSIEDDIFADVFCQEADEKCVESPAKDAGSKSTSMMEKADDSKSNLDEIVHSKKALEIVVDPKEPIEDDMFADVFSHKATEKSSKSSVESVGDESISLKENSTLSKPNTDVDDQSREDTPVEKTLEIVINPEEPIEDDIFGDVLSQEIVEKSLKSSVEDAVAESILMMTEKASNSKLSSDEIDQLKDDVEKKTVEIVIKPNEPIEDDDIFADVFSNPHPVKPALEPSETDSPGKSKALPKSLEIVINPEKSPDEDIFADVFSNAGPTSSLSDSKIEERVVEPSQNGTSVDIDNTDDKVKSRNTLEITVNPDEPPDDDDDLFADVFSGNPDTKSQEQIKPSFRKLIDDIKNTSRDLSDIKNVLEKESQQLASETKREEKLTSTITEQMTQEAQDLLELFGIPYLVAPMEAEAQCAYLDLTGQTEGTITDDSDIWLFGANNVYKNFFDQKKFVKLFKSSDIHQCYRLNRDDLIMIALLVGSDYTSGLAGVGPVNAIEIVAHFPRSQGAPTPQDRLLKFVDAYVSSDMNQQLFRKLKSIEFTDGFPSDEVVKAYLSPIVDESKEKFSWSQPDLTKIKHFMRDKVGWDFNRTDKTLIPILDKLKQCTTQKTIHNYFDWAFDVDEAATVSKRVGNAVEILTTGIIPSPTKKLRRDEPVRKLTEPKDRLVSNYTRRKYGRYQQQEKDLENEPVLEGMKAAKAAAKAIMAAIRKPVVKSSESQPAEVAGPSTEISDLPTGVSTVRRRGRPRKDAQDPKDASANEKVSPKKQKLSMTQDPIASSSTGFKAPAEVPLPALSDILCGIGSEPSVAEEPRLWTPSKDLVSPYTKRKYGKLGQSTAAKRDSSNFTVPQGPSQSFERVMPSKNPAQIARERAAKKLKEAKLKAAQSKAKKSTSK